MIPYKKWKQQLNFESTMNKWLWPIYHSHMDSCNDSSIRIIIYTAAEDWELLIRCRWEHLLVSGLQPFLKNDDRTI